MDWCFAAQNRISQTAAKAVLDNFVTNSLVSFLSLMVQQQHQLAFTTGVFSVWHEESWSLVDWSWLCWPVSSFAVLTEPQHGWGWLSWGLLCPTTPDLLAKLFPVQARRDAATALCRCSKNTLLVYGQPVVCQVPASSAKLLSSSGLSPACMFQCLGLFLPRCRALHIECREHPLCSFLPPAEVSEE